MENMIEWLRGPGFWATCAIFLFGILWRVGRLYTLSKENDRIICNHSSLGWGLRSIGHWLLPLGSRSMRKQPVFSLACYAFHILLFAVPLFLVAHNSLWDYAFGVSFWSMSNGLADILTLFFIALGLLLVLRRLVRPEVRIITGFSGYTMTVRTLLPAITGYMAAHGIGPYLPVLLLHLVTSELLIISIPFTKLGHSVLFFFTRAFIGFEMGNRRGARPW